MGVTEDIFPVRTDFLGVLMQGNQNGVPARLSALFAPESYNADSLDVSSFFPYANRERCVIRFDKLPDVLSTPCRVYARLEVFFGKAPSTVQGHLGCLTTLFNEMSKRGVWDYHMIELDDVKAVMNSGRFSDDHCARMCGSLKFFLMVMKSFCGQSLIRMDMDGLENLRRMHSALEAATENAHKTPDIDSSYFEVLENGLPALVFDESIPINYRIVAALQWLDMYVGLRRSELFTLTVNSHVVKTTANGRQADYLYYGVPKLSHGGRVRKYAECYMLPGAVTAFNALLELRKQVPGHENTDSLIVFENKCKNGKNDKEGKDGETESRRFRYYRTRMFLEYFSELCSSHWDEVKTTTIDGKIYHIPNLTQFRVHLCGYLYNQGIRLHIIELGMSHLTDSMVAYYVRVKDKTFRKQNSRLDNIIRTRINNDFDLEDHDEKGEELLHDFLLSLSKFRTYADMRAKMEAKGYDYEVDRYTRLCRNVIFTEIRPALSYLCGVLLNEGRDRVLEAHPGLKRVVNNIEGILNEIGQWERQHMI